MGSLETRLYSSAVIRLPALRNVPKKLLEDTANVDKVLSKFKTRSITKTNELFYTTGAVATNRLGVKKGTNVEEKVAK